MPAEDRGRAGSQSAAETTAAISASATFGGVSVQPPPPRASEARAAEERPGVPLPRARAAAALPWQPGGLALYACASSRRRLRAHPGLGDSGWGQVLQTDVSGCTYLRREKGSGPRLRITVPGRNVTSPVRLRYRSLAMCAVLRQPKCVKLRALHSTCKFGVAARSCQELLRKGCVRFQVGLAFRASTARRGPWLPPVRFPSS